MSASAVRAHKSLDSGATESAGKLTLVPTETSEPSGAGVVSASNSTDVLRCVQREQAKTRDIVAELEQIQTQQSQELDELGEFVKQADLDGLDEIIAKLRTNSAHHLGGLKHKIDETLGCNSTIMGISQRLENLHEGARVLAVNLAIESARLGNQGAAVAVCARSFAEMTTELESANDMIVSLSQRLHIMLPQLVQQAEAANVDAEHQFRKLDDGQRELVARLGETISYSYTCVARNAERSALCQSMTKDLLQMMRAPHPVEQLLELENPEVLASGTAGDEAISQESSEGDVDLDSEEFDCF